MRIRDANNARAESVAEAHDGVVGRGRPMRETCCPQCRSVARLVRNPYYGAGLAVHADLLVCEACGYSGYADNPEREPSEDELADAPAGAVRRLLRLLAHR
jgi:hypothetical protein